MTPAQIMATSIKDGIKGGISGITADQEAYIVQSWTPICQVILDYIQSPSGSVTYYIPANTVLVDAVGGVLNASPIQLSSGS